MKLHSPRAARRDGARRLRVVLATGALVAASGLGCVVANPNHCVNRDTDGNAWCKARDAERPFCNPCSAVNDGCQATEPQLANPRGEDYCFDYVSPGTTSGAPPTSTGDGDGDGDGDDSSGSDGDSSSDGSSESGDSGSDSSDGDSGTDSSGGDSSGGDSSSG